MKEAWNFLQTAAKSKHCMWAPLTSSISEALYISGQLSPHLTPTVLRFPHCGLSLEREKAFIDALRLWRVQIFLCKRRQNTWRPQPLLFPLFPFFSCFFYVLFCFSILPTVPPSFSPYLLTSQKPSFTSFFPSFLPSFPPSFLWAIEKECDFFFNIYWFEKARGKEKYLLPTCSLPNVCNSWGWVRPKLRAQYSAGSPT